MLCPIQALVVVRTVYLWRLLVGGLEELLLVRTLRDNDPTTTILEYVHMCGISTNCSNEERRDGGGRGMELK